MENFDKCYWRFKQLNFRNVSDRTNRPKIRLSNILPMQSAFFFSFFLNQSLNITTRRELYYCCPKEYNRYFL